MKRYKVLIMPVLFAPVLLAAVYFLAKPESGITPISSDHQDLKVKEGEIRSRLLEVPIILYHDIDGKGPFAVSGKKIREHFDYLKKEGYTVVPLSDLIDRLDNPRPYDRKVIVITFDDGYKNMYAKLLPLVREYRYPVTLFVYVDFVSDRPGKAITWKELREMQKSGIDIQCHTKSHQDLPKLAIKDTPEAREKLYEELYLSRIVIQAQLGKPVDLLAFPFGYYDLDTIQLALHAGYRRVFSTDDGPNIVTRNNFCLRRHHIKRDYSLEKVASIIR